VLNINIHSLTPNKKFPFYGFIEIALLETNKDFQEKYSYSINYWKNSQYYYYNQETGTWLSASEYQDNMQEIFEPKCYSPLGLNWSTYFPLLLLILFFFWLARHSKKLTKKNKDYMDSALNAQELSLQLVKESIELQKVNNQILKDILQTLKGQER